MADDEIIRRTGIDSDPGSLTVVTSDRPLADRVRAAGAGRVVGAGGFRRRLDPMNAERISLLDELERQGHPLAPESIIRAFVGPSLRLIEDAKGGGRNFIRLLGRTYTEPAKSVRALIGQMYAPAMERYKAALERALPQMPRDELVWRMHFMFGTLSYTLAATDTVQLIAGCKPEDRYDARLLKERLTAFLAAGLHAPLRTPIKKAA